jgi:hypothetical protein
MSIRDNFTVDAGGTLVRTYVYTTEEGTPVDLTDYTAKAQVRHSSKGTLILEAEPTIDTETATITMTWTPAQTKALVDSNYVYGLEVATEDEADVIVLATGVVTVNQEIVK